MSVLYAVAPNGKVSNIVAVDNRDTAIPDFWYEVTESQIEDGEVDRGYTTPDGGQTWVHGEPLPPPIEITSDQVATASQTLQALLDPSTPNPSVIDSLTALAVLVGVSSAVDDSAAVLIDS